MGETLEWLRVRGGALFLRSLPPLDSVAGSGMNMKRGQVSLVAVSALLCLMLSGLSACAPVTSVSVEVPPGRRSINIEQLSAVVQDGARSDRARLHAAKRLVSSSDPRGLNSLFAVVTDDRERALLRAVMTRLLGRSPQRHPVAAFLRGRLTDASEAAEVRAAAAASLGSLQASSQDTLALLRLATGDAAPTVRLAARNALMKIGGEGIDRTPLLIATVQDFAQPGVARASAAKKLEALKDQRALPVLITALQEKGLKRPPARTLHGLFAARTAIKRNLPAAAARALGRLGDPAAISPLIDAASTLQGEARVAAYEALATLKARAAVPVARTALSSDLNQRVRRWAARLLREVAAKEALRTLTPTQPSPRGLQDSAT